MIALLILYMRILTDLGWKIVHCEWCEPHPFFLHRSKTAVTSPAQVTMLSPSKFDVPRDDSKLKRAGRQIVAGGIAGMYNYNYMHLYCSHTCRINRNLFDASS